MERSRRSRVPSAMELQELKELFQHHIDSYDYFLNEGLDKMLININPIEVHDKLSSQSLRIWFDKHDIVRPQRERASVLGKALYPFECRQAKSSYCGHLYIHLNFRYNGDDGAIRREKFSFGQFPIMLKSKLCSLRDCDPSTLVSHKEEASEMGGYFILNGLERVVRLLIVPKRNYPRSMVRKAFRNRREGYTDKAVVIRCVREDQSALTLKLYYLSNGSARVGFWLRGREYLLPVGLVLKALIDTSDHEIFTTLTSVYNAEYERMRGAVGTQIVGERAKIILNEVKDLNLFTRIQCLRHIGAHFKPVIDGMDNESYDAVGNAVLQDFILVHLDNNHDKFNLLIFMLQKLFSLVDQTSAPDNEDSLQNQELLLPGHLMTIYLKEKLQEWLLKIRRLLQDETDKQSKTFKFSEIADVKKIMERNPSKNFAVAIENMLKTGRLTSQSGLDLQENSGLTVQAERLNYLRFLSHFRAVHRGASFARLRTTSVRKLLPESWGFVCPVHTPDGEPCGLLNHMTSSCRITSYYDREGNVKEFSKMKKSIVSVLIGVGMTPSLPKLVQAGPPLVLSVLLDGCIVGSMPSEMVEKAVSHLRRLKLSAISAIPYDLEVGYIPPSMGGAYPGLYLFTCPSRFVRPVRHKSPPPDEKNDIEFIGPFEQVYMEIECPDGGNGGRSEEFPASHEEIHPTGILSVVANLTPWSDHNQSPRNMYQCQMAKQTMGFASQGIHCRADQKLYHLQTPQSPIVRTGAYGKYRIDDHPLGTNAIVAVLAYTGYDMEDAMVLNKSSVERGFCHGHIYQTETIDLTEKGPSSHSSHQVFRRSTLKKSEHSFIDSDGLPFVGQKLNPQDPYYSIYNEVTSATKCVNLKASEAAVVDYVAIDGRNKEKLQKVNIRTRRSRNPVIGDKFSSRHGQKGVCSQLWPDIDMPFSATTGMRPDLIINPHAFPSRMTIAMLLESIAAKGGALNGEFVDATPFVNSAKKGDSKHDDADSLVKDLGSQLTKHGFNHYGVEVLYSGVYGTELTCEIFVGPVYYQRLRHMVSDKYQVRSTGVTDQVTRQPIKGRKAGGGIRFGEMERDSLLAHGAAYLLHDRLHTSSDYHIANICSICGSILTTSFTKPEKKIIADAFKLLPGSISKNPICIACKTSKGMETVAMPYVFRYLAAELGAMNIRMTLKLKNATQP